MTQTTPAARPATGLVPAQRTPAAGPGRTPAAAPAVSTARRLLAIALGVRSRRSVPARPQESYGECDGQ
ncbi:hypothetical protein ACIA8O_09175 [Kitasatospora sp. NPDC051853]|uniref:hypothetical protein n=1 Tax=Kitasatospora sp. NPDC051853 TaxID=3364058 RepID=UPI00379AD245